MGGKTLRSVAMTSSLMHPAVISGRNPGARSSSRPGSAGATAYPLRHHGRIQRENSSIDDRIRNCLRCLPVRAESRMKEAARGERNPMS